MKAMNENKNIRTCFNPECNKTLYLIDFLEGNNSLNKLEKKMTFKEIKDLWWIKDLRWIYFSHYNQLISWIWLI